MKLIFKNAQFALNHLILLINDNEDTALAI